MKQHLVKMFLFVWLTSNHIFACSSSGTICFSNVLLEKTLVHLEFLLAVVTENIFRLLSS